MQGLDGERSATPSVEVAQRPQPGLVLRRERCGLSGLVRERPLEIEEVSPQGAEGVIVLPELPGIGIETTEWSTGDTPDPDARAIQIFVHGVDDDEWQQLIADLPVKTVETYDSDGRGGGRNRYVLMRPARKRA